MFLEKCIFELQPASVMPRKAAKKGYKNAKTVGAVAARGTGSRQHTKADKVEDS